MIRALLAALPFHHQYGAQISAPLFPSTSLLLTSHPAIHRSSATPPSTTTAPTLDDSEYSEDAAADIDRVPDHIVISHSPSQQHPLHDGRPAAEPRGPSEQEFLSTSAAVLDPSTANTSLTSDLMPKTRRLVVAIVSTVLSYITLSQLYAQFNPGHAGREQANDEARWVATSHSWLDRKACEWFGLCGVAHFRLASSELRLARQKRRKQQHSLGQGHPDEDDIWKSAWHEGKSRPEDWTDDERVLREIPGFVLDYAPLVHLNSGEQFWPCDIEEHLNHVTPHLNYTPVTRHHPNLTNLDRLNEYNRGRYVFLKSDDDVEERPEWLGGEKNIPNTPGEWADDEDETAWAEWDGRIDGELPDDVEYGREGWFDVGEGSVRNLGGLRPNPTGSGAPVPTDTVEGEELMDEAPETPKRSLGKRVRGGRSDAPAVLIVVDKGDGVVDAFWFYFYSYNLGNIVLNVRFGNHVGDWEHSLVRFYNGQPKAVFFSEHFFGEAYSYEAVEKIGKRPVVYSAIGTHAMYATPGTHEYILPWGLLHDFTDRGPLWDPLLNSHAYTYDYLSDTLRSSNVTPSAPTEWFYFAGHWGDKSYPLSDKRQYRFAGQYHYVNGPLGPRFKNLGRKKICQGNGDCTVKNWIGGSLRPRRWAGPGIGDEWSEDDL
ncbi:MAG: hypothetical protein M1819_000944 [Sarea resinae]|nr:MAG: hypothetical protein M1819_000944 [Sarea resinae]